MNFFIFGDSITWGAWDREGGWAERIKKYIHQKVITSNFNTYYSVYTLGIPGDTTKSLLDRMEREIIARIDPLEPTVDKVIINAIGINDSQVELATGTNEIPINEFEQNVQEIYNIGTKYSAEVIFIGITPVDEIKVNPMEWKQTHGYQTAEVEKYNELLKQFSGKNNIGFIELMNKFPKNYQELLIDGVHPNEEGHKLIFEIIKNYLGHQKLI